MSHDPSRYDLMHPRRPQRFLAMAARFRRGIANVGALGPDYIERLRRDHAQALAAASLFRPNLP